VIIELAVALSTLVTGGAPVVADWVPLLLFPVMFGVMLSSILRVRRSRAGLRGVLAAVPAPLMILAAGLGGAVALVAAYSFAGAPSGQPTTRNGLYYLDDHGALRPVSRAAYDNALAVQQRLFTLVPTMFFLMAVIVHYPAIRAATGGDPSATRRARIS
jgi:hypothetical protein